MRVLTREFVRHYAGRLINIHPSLLPLFPGLRTHQQALDAGVRVHGATVHFVSEQVDTGGIIAQAVVPVVPGDDAATLASRVLEQEHRLLPRALRLVLEQRVRWSDGQRGRARRRGRPTLPAEPMKRARPPRGMKARGRDDRRTVIGRRGRRSSGAGPRTPASPRDRARRGRTFDRASHVAGRRLTGACARARADI